MKHRIYYFSGTGNSLWAVRRLAASFEGQVELVDMTGDIPGELDATARVGFVFPLHFYGIPPLVKKVVQDLKLTGKNHVYTVITAMFPNGFALEQFAGLLKEGVSLQYGRYITMPNSYILTRKSNSPAQVKRLLAKAQQRLDRFARDIQGGKVHQDKEWNLYNRMENAREKYGKWTSELPRLTQRFQVNGECTGCSSCARQCPVGALVMEDGRPKWGQTCQMCLRCLHFCPGQAIDFSDQTQEKNRYSHFKALVRSSKPSSSMRGGSLQS